MRRFLIALLITVITFCFSTPEVLADQSLDKKVSKLEKKVSKKFSKTFCNSTGFGISNEGALKFALGETKSELSKNPLLDTLDLEKVVCDYEVGGAKAISVLTDEYWFGGSLETLVAYVLIFLAKGFNV